MSVSLSNTRHAVKTELVRSAPTQQALAATLPATTPPGGDVSIGRRLLDWKTLAGFGLSAAIVVFFVVTTHLDVGSIWANMQAADVRFLGLAILVYFGAF